jgi:hypothetical protein
LTGRQRYEKIIINIERARITCVCVNGEKDRVFLRKGTRSGMISEQTRNEMKPGRLVVVEADDTEEVKREPK